MGKMISKVSLILLCLLTLLKPVTYIKANHLVKENPEFNQHEAVNSALNQLDRVRDDLNIKDLSQRDSPASSMEDLLENIGLGDEGYQYQLAEDLHLVVYQYEIEDDVSDLYFLFFDEALIYISLFDFSFPKKLETESYLVSIGLLNYQGQETISYQIVQGTEASDLELSQYIQLSDQRHFVSKKPYFKAIQAGHERQLYSMLNYLGVDNEAVLSSLAQEFLSFDDEGEVESQENLLIDIEEADRKQLLDEMFSETSKMTDYAVLAQGADQIVVGAKEGQRIRQADIIEKLGPAYSVYQEDDKVILTYVSEWYGYYLEEFILIEDRLYERVQEFHHLELFDSFSQQSLQQVEELSEFTQLEYADLLRILGPAWQIRDNLIMESRTYSWMKYVDESVDYIILSEGPTETNLQIETKSQ